MRSKIFIVVGMILTSVVASAALSVSTVTALVISNAVEKFQKEETPATVGAFIGVKGWPAGGGYSVKVYLSNSTKEIAYACEYMDHSGQPMVDCHK